MEALKVDKAINWCRGCGNYAILHALKKTLMQRGLNRDEVVFVSGIGCSSRLPYYINTYGIHGIHGRGAALASGVKLANPDLSVWLITGDGDCLSIGTNHFIHAIRKDIDINILIVNNKVYALTKGQCSPTTGLGTITTTTPAGCVHKPLEAGAIVLGSGGGFFARTIDTNLEHMVSMFTQACQHKGTSVVEIISTCVKFGDTNGENIPVGEGDSEKELFLAQGERMVFGGEKGKGIRQEKNSLSIISLAEGEDGGNLLDDVLRHDIQSSDKTLQYLLLSLEYPICMGVFRDVPAE